MIIQSSISIKNGFGFPNARTVFSHPTEDDRKHPLFRSLIKLSGRRLIIEYLIELEETNDIIKKKSIVIVPSYFIDEYDIKRHIIEELIEQQT
jgi:hypothetical protein